MLFRILWAVEREKLQRNAFICLEVILFSYSRLCNFKEQVEAVKELTALAAMTGNIRADNDEDKSSMNCSKEW
jgi:hypothetical protein